MKIVKNVLNYNFIFKFRPTISSSVLKSRAHRERSQTQNTKKLSKLSSSNNKQPELNKIDESHKVSSNSTKDVGLTPKLSNTSQTGYFICFFIVILFFT